MFTIYQLVQDFFHSFTKDFLKNVVFMTWLTLGYAEKSAKGRTGPQA